MAQSLEEFIQDRPRWDGFRAKLDPLLNELLMDSGITFHIVESRTKSSESYAEKLKNPTKGYQETGKLIPDLVGCRIIVYYYDDVSRVADIIKDQFDIIEEELAHQPSAIDADRFGYLSAHYVIRLARNRRGLAEWKRYSDCHAELQIRTVVQHAWSAVSHALQYKREVGVPPQLQRRLYRIAGLFELADEEFVGIRNQRAALDESAKNNVRARKEKVVLDTSTVAAFAGEWFKRQNIVSKLKEANFQIADEDEEEAGYVSEIYELAANSGIKYVDELEKRLDFDPLPFLKAFSAAAQGGSWPGSPMFALLLCSLLAFKELVSRVYLESHDWGPDAIRNVLARLEEF